MVKVMLTEDFQTHSIAQDSTSKRTIDEGVHMSYGLNAMVCSEVSLCCDGIIFLMTSVMVACIGGG